MANKFLKTFESHTISKRDEDNKPVSENTDEVNETVKQVDDIYKVGSINIPQSLINSYVKKVKDETQKNLRQLYSDMEIAEELVRYAVDTHLNSDELPVSALLGGAEDEEIGDDLESDVPEEEITAEESPEEEVSEEPVSDEEEVISDELNDLEEEGGEELFEEPGEGGEETEEETEEGGEEEAELPI